MSGICETIPEGQFQWFINIISYLQFVTGETVSTAESHRDEVNSDKVWKTNDQPTIIYTFKTYVTPIIGRLVEGKESTTPLT